ncbi:MAG: hypothetical protein R2941_11400 [Desulfobacterales bacterium]
MGTGMGSDAYRNIISDPLFMIFGQVVHGGIVSNLVQHFGIKPRAVIGYSLGESAGYFATGAWPERDEMPGGYAYQPVYHRTVASLPCWCKAWKIPADQSVE